MKIYASNDLAAVSGDSVETLRIANDADLGALAADGALQRAGRIELEFPKFTDGRAFSQAVMLRRRYRFGGDLRATGDVLIDLLVHMQRSGFSSAVLDRGGLQHRDDVRDALVETCRGAGVERDRRHAAAPAAARA